MTDYNRAAKAIIKSFEEFTESFDALNKQLKGDQAESLRKMMVSYTDLYRETVAKDELIVRFLREKQQELSSINHDLHTEKMQKLQDQARQLREKAQAQLEN